MVRGSVTTNSQPHSAYCSIRTRSLWNRWLQLPSCSWTKRAITTVERVLRVVLDDILCPSNVQVAMAKMSEELTKPYEERHAILQAIESELADLDQRQARVMEAFEAGAYTVDDYSRRMTPLRATEVDLKEKRAEAAREIDHQTAVLTKPR